MSDTELQVQANGASDDEGLLEEEPTGPRKWFKHLKGDVGADGRIKGVIAWPVSNEDLQPALVTKLMKQCHTFIVRYLKIDGSDKYVGFLQMTFWRYEDACQFVENKSQILGEHVEVVQGQGRGQAVNRQIEDMFGISHGWQMRAIRDDFSKQVLVAEPLPDQMADSELSALFPDCKHSFVARFKEFGNSGAKGYGYIEYESEEGAKAAAAKYQNLNFRGDQLTVQLYSDYLADLKENAEKLPPALGPQRRKDRRELGKEVHRLKFAVRKAEREEDQGEKEALQDELNIARDKLTPLAIQQRERNIAERVLRLPKSQRTSDGEGRRPPRDGRRRSGGGRRNRSGPGGYDDYQGGYQGGPQQQQQGGQGGADMNPQEVNNAMKLLVGMSKMLSGPGGQQGGQGGQGAVAGDVDYNTLMQRMGQMGVDGAQGGGRGGGQGAGRGRNKRRNNRRRNRSSQNPEDLEHDQDHDHDHHDDSHED